MDKLPDSSQQPEKPKPKPLPYRLNEAPGPSGREPSVFWYQIGFLLVVYVGMLVFTVVAHPFAKQFIEPLVAFIFPIAEGNTLIKSVTIVTIFFWVPALIRLAIETKKAKEESAKEAKDKEK